MNTNDFLLIKDNIPVKCSALAVLYSDDSNRGFIVYDDGTNKENKLILKIGEIKVENDEVIIENLKDDNDINYIWNKFIEMYKNTIHDFKEV